MPKQTAPDLEETASRHSRSTAGRPRANSTISDLRDHNPNRPLASSQLRERDAGDLRFLRTVGDRW
jgi:hypothetical protein